MNLAYRLRQNIQCFLCLLRTLSGSFIKYSCCAKIVSECDQEIPQSQTADNPMAPRGRATQPPRDTRKTNQAKQPALSSPSR